jgi:hypothetical protein
MLRLIRFSLIGLLATWLLGCEYVRPTVNAPLKEWNPGYGYKFANLAPPEEGNSDSLLFSASFSGGGTRASTLNSPAIRLYGRASRSVYWMSSTSSMPCPVGPSPAPTMRYSGIGSFTTSNPAFCG